jgi:glutathione S-transferase
MKCYVTNNSPYARKVRIVALELGLYDEIEWKTLTREERGDLQIYNPLGKVPVAILDTGDIVCDSPVICAYVDSLPSSRNLIPESGSKRWEGLTLEALGDGLGDAVIVISQENQRSNELRSQDVVDRQLSKIKSALSVLDKVASDFNDPPLIGEIAVACSLGYMDFREIFPEWRESYANMASWYTIILKRQSFTETAPS